MSTSRQPSSMVRYQTSGDGGGGVDDEADEGRHRRHGDATQRSRSRSRQRYQRHSHHRSRTPERHRRRSRSPSGGNHHRRNRFRSRSRTPIEAHHRRNRHSRSRTPAEHHQQRRRRHSRSCSPSGGQRQRHERERNFDRRESGRSHYRRSPMSRRHDDEYQQQKNATKITSTSPEAGSGSTAGTTMQPNIESRQYANSNNFATSGKAASYYASSSSVTSSLSPTAKQTTANNAATSAVGAYYNLDTDEPFDKARIHREMEAKLRETLAKEGKVYPPPKSEPSHPVFANDGSFLELFKKMQQMQQQQQYHPNQATVLHRPPTATLAGTATALTTTTTAAAAVDVAAATGRSLPMSMTTSNNIAIAMTTTSQMPLHRELGNGGVVATAGCQHIMAGCNAVSFVTKASDGAVGVGGGVYNSAYGGQIAMGKKAAPPPPPPVVGRRRGGKILKTGVVAKPKTQTEESTDPKDFWSLYLAEVNKYKNTACDSDGGKRPLVNDKSSSTDSNNMSAYKLETAPFDPRFPNQNVTRYCYQSYIDYHRCVKKRGADFAPCNYFQKVYKTMCPNAWIEKWDEQRESGTFPGRI